MFDPITVALSSGSQQIDERRGGYTTMENVFSETVIKYNSSKLAYPLDFVPTLGETYIVMVDGKKWTYEAKYKSIYNGESDLVFIYLGCDTEKNDGYTDDEPWIILYRTDDNTCFFGRDTSKLGRGDVTISIDREIVHPFSPKYIPGVCLPVVDIYTEIVDEVTYFTAEESVALSEAAATGLPVVIRKIGEDESFSTIIMSNDNGVALFATVEGITILFYLDGESEDVRWCATVYTPESSGAAVLG